MPAPGDTERPLVARDEPPRRQPNDMKLARERGAMNRARRSKRRMALVLAYSSLGHTAPQIAAELGCAVATVREMQLRLRQTGTLDDVVQKLERIAVPEAVDGLIEALQDRKQWAIQDTLKGRGFLLSGSGGAGAALQMGPPPPLTVNVVLAPGVPQDDPRLKPIPGNIVGAPRLSAADVVDDDEKLSLTERVKAEQKRSTS